jgi:hypothetical protein
MITIILIAVGAVIASVVLMAWAVCSAAARAEEVAAMMWSLEGTSEVIERCYLCGTLLGWRPETLVDAKATCKKCKKLLEEGK